MPPKSGLRQNKICSLCDQSTPKDFLECESCNRFYHAVKPCGIWTPAQFTSFSQLDLPGMTNICQSCKPKIPGIVARLEQLETKQAEQDLRIASLEQRHQSNSSLDEIEPRISRIEQTLRSFQTDVVNSIGDSLQSAVQNAIREINEKEKKSWNLVIVGLPELENENTKVVCVKVAKFLSTQFDWDGCINGARRFGTVSHFSDGTVKNRIVKIFFNDKSARSFFLSNYHRLVNDANRDLLGNSFCRPDLTESEREEDYKLRQEVIRRRNAKEGDFVIRNGRLIRRVDRQSRRPPIVLPTGGPPNDESTGEGSGEAEVESG